jgi:nucleoside-diphosphate-sugar epimerase
MYILHYNSISNVDGPGRKYNRSRGVIPTLIDHVSSNLPITIYGDGDEFCDYLFIDDVGLVVAELLLSRENVQRQRNRHFMCIAL